MQEGGGVPTGNVQGRRSGGIADGQQDSVSHSQGRGPSWCTLLGCRAQQALYHKKLPCGEGHHLHHRHICSDHFLPFGSEVPGGGVICF